MANSRKRVKYITSTDKVLFPYKTGGMALGSK